MALLDRQAVASTYIRSMLASGRDDRSEPFGLASTYLDGAEALLTGRHALGFLDLDTACFTAVSSINAEELGRGLERFMTTLNMAARTAHKDMLAAPSGPKYRMERKSTGASDKETPPKAGDEARARILRVGGGETACLRIAWSAPRRDAPDYPAFFVAQHTLGGGYRSRLMRRFRNELGWSYSPWSVIRHEPGRSFMEVNVEVPMEHHQAAWGVVLAAVAELREEPLPWGELRRATATACGTAAAALAPQRGLAASLTHVRALGVEAGWLWRWPQALARVRPADVLNAAHRYLRVADAVRVTVLPTTYPREQDDAKEL
ncbi:insulinase family protein [Streptomyces sp. NPDC003077]|uniref:insulinase family protein n=1 Tax=Streptomyces sp. NPDC003077 TaxID=3154443 RepID=UPI0033B3F2F8